MNMERAGEPGAPSEEYNLPINAESQEPIDDQEVVDHNYELLKAALQMPSGVVVVSERAKELTQSPFANTEQGKHISQSRLEVLTHLKDKVWSASSSAASKIGDLLKPIAGRIGLHSADHRPSHVEQVYPVTKSLSSQSKT